MIGDKITDVQVEKGRDELQKIRFEKLRNIRYNWYLNEKCKEDHDEIQCIGNNFRAVLLANR